MVGPAAGLSRDAVSDCHCIVPVLSYDSQAQTVQYNSGTAFRTLDPFPEIDVVLAAHYQSGLFAARTVKSQLDICLAKTIQVILVDYAHVMPPPIGLLSNTLFLIFLKALSYQHEDMFIVVFKF